MAALTDKQERFVQGLINGKSQREAYKAAYNCKKMKDKTVDEKASKLFRADKVRARYNEVHDRLIQEAEDECIITVKDVLREIATVALLSLDDPKVIVGIVKASDKNKALEMAGKHLGMFTDKLQLSGEVQIDDARTRLLEKLTPRG